MLLNVWVPSTLLNCQTAHKLDDVANWQRKLSPRSMRHQTWKQTIDDVMFHGLA